MRVERGLLDGKRRVNLGGLPEWTYGIPSFAVQEGWGEGRVDSERVQGELVFNKKNGSARLSVHPDNWLSSPVRGATGISTR